MATPNEVWKQTHGDDIFDYVDEIEWYKKHMPWIYGIKDEADNLTETGTRINEPKSDDGSTVQVDGGNIDD